MAPPSHPTEDIDSGTPPQRDFRAFLRDNYTKLYGDTLKREALRVGDYIEIRMGEFMSWHGLAADDAPHNIGEVIHGMLIPSHRDTEPLVKVCILEIKDSGHTIIVEANGVRKTVDASLFFNKFKQRDLPIDVVSKNHHQGMEEDAEDSGVG